MVLIKLFKQCFLLPLEMFLKKKKNKELIAFQTKFIFSQSYDLLLICIHKHTHHIHVNKYMISISNVCVNKCMYKII